MSINKRMYKLCSHIMEYCIEKNEQTTDIYDNMDESHRYDIALKKKKKEKKARHKSILYDSVSRE